LDKQELIQEVQGKTTGQDLLNNIYKHLNLIETAYFGLRYQDNSNQTHWLDPNKRVSQQIKGVSPITLYLGVKFYAADPCRLVEEITRYQFFLQVKLDVLQGRLPVPIELGIELAALSIQSELGDFDRGRHSPGYASEFRFLASQTEDLEKRVELAHGKLVGLLPSQAENRYLEKVKWLDMYGVDLHPVIGEDNIEYFLGLTPSGIIVLRNRNKVGNYFWPRISKIYFKGKYFMLRVRDKNNEESTYGFETPSRQACKHLWKCCVEHHAFFRLVQVNPANGSTNMFGLASKFRYSGRTEKEVTQEIPTVNRPQPPFTRVPSERFSRRSRSEETGTQGDRKRTYSGGTLKRNGNGSSHMNLSQRYLSSSNLHEQSLQNSSFQDNSSMLGLQSLPANLQGVEGNPNVSLQSLQYLESKGLFGSRSQNSRRGSEVDQHNGYSGDVSMQTFTKRRSSRKGGSDDESEVSGVSLASAKHHRGRHDRSAESGSESESSRAARRNHRGRRRRSSSYKLIDTNEQWKEVQKQQGRRGKSEVSEATVRKSGYVNSGAETESELVATLRKNKRRQRSRSRSPSEARSKLPSELIKHFDFDLQDPPEDTSKLQEIPYTNVETQKPIKVRYSHGSRSRHASGNSSKKIMTNSISRGRDGDEFQEISNYGSKAESMESSQSTEESSKTSRSQSNNSQDDDNSLSNSSHECVQVPNTRNINIQPSYSNIGLNNHPTMPYSVPPPNVSKPAPPLPPSDPQPFWSQTITGPTNYDQRYMNQVSLNNSLNQSNLNVSSNIMPGMHSVKISQNNSPYRGPHQSLPSHISSQSLHNDSPIMGYKAVNPPIGDILNNSALGLPSIHNGNNQNNQSSLISSSSTNSATSSPQHNENNNHLNYSNKGLPPSGSSVAYASYQNFTPYSNQDIQALPSPYSNQSGQMVQRQTMKIPTGSPSRSQNSGQPPPLPSMAGRRPVPQPQTPQRNHQNSSLPPPMPGRAPNIQNQAFSTPKQDNQSSSISLIPNMHKMAISSGVNKKLSNLYEPSGDEMSTEL